MNERIKELAEQANLDVYQDGWVEGGIDRLERFAELVRQDERNLQRTKKEWSDHDRAIAAYEREACAKVCDEWVFPVEIQGAHPDYLEGKRMAIAQCAAAIRARSE